MNSGADNGRGIPWSQEKVGWFPIGVVEGRLMGRRAEEGDGRPYHMLAGGGVEEGGKDVGRLARGSTYMCSFFNVPPTSHWLNWERKNWTEILDGMNFFIGDLSYFVQPNHKIQSSTLLPCGPLSSKLKRGSDRIAQEEKSSTGINGTRLLEADEVDLVICSKLVQLPCSRLLEVDALKSPLRSESGKGHLFRKGSFRVTCESTAFSDCILRNWPSWLDQRDACFQLSAMFFASSCSCRPAHEWALLSTALGNLPLIAWSENCGGDRNFFSLLPLEERNCQDCTERCHPLRGIGFCSGYHQYVCFISMHNLLGDRIDRESSTSLISRDVPSSWMRTFASVFDPAAPLTVCVSKTLFVFSNCFLLLRRQWRVSHHLERCSTVDDVFLVIWKYNRSCCGWISFFGCHE